jgi:branched-chain amino acid transport system substrate-binding protein
MAEAPIDDALFGPTTIRKDCRAVHDMFLIQVKMPAESKARWDLLQGRRHHPGS